MTAAAPEPTAPVPPAKDLKSIRTALLPEDLSDFDSGLRRAMNTAADHLDLAPVHEFIEAWWRIAVSSMDPERHRAARRDGEALLRGEPVRTVDATELIRRRLADLNR
ncbi:DUF6247 family protein [Actinocorallia longicatena]|uniref:Addiction module component n=1 Tax=Actinocorallia longicatena TaxID=111803 RepID=A0ABP6QDF5_9ACTN